MDWSNGPLQNSNAPLRKKLNDMPVALGEVASGIVANGTTMVVVGEGSDATLALNLATGQWEGVNSRAIRPYPGTTLIFQYPSILEYMHP